MATSALKQHVSNRGVPPDSFLKDLIAWGKKAPEEIFAPNDASDVYSSVKNTLGPWQSNLHRRAVMLEVLRVLAGFESSWDWNEGVDKSSKQKKTPMNTEAGAFQVSADSMGKREDLRALVKARVGSLTDGTKFQAKMKSDHAFALEYIARLLRHTTAANGPVVRHEIDPWLRRDAVDEFLASL
jgi:hypothetical protein